MRQDAGPNWHEIEPILAVHLLVLGAREAGSATYRQADVELLERILQSCQATKRYLDAADRAPPLVGFIAAEQSLYFGHPLHSTPKSLQGVSNWQQDVYAPDFICHLHEIALCLSEQYELPDNRLWRILGEETGKAFDALKPRMLSDELWRQERTAFLEKPWPTRSVLRMHLERYRDYRVEHELPNPLAEAE